RWSLERLRAELDMLDHRLQPPCESQLEPSPVDIYADLVGLHEEFEQVSFDRQRKTLSVTTEASELEGVYLGPFEIRLGWSDLKYGHTHHYRVIAVEANPATAN